MDDFHELRSPGRFPGVFGCVDWIHNAINLGRRQTQAVNTLQYNRKRFQMVCDDCLRLIDCFVGFSSSIAFEGCDMFV